MMKYSHLYKSNKSKLYIHDPKGLFFSLGMLGKLCSLYPFGCAAAAFLNVCEFNNYQEMVQLYYYVQS